MAENISKKLECHILTTFEGTKSSIAITDGNSTETVKIKLIDPHRSYHGTGCTFSSALASFLAQGNSIKEATQKASAYTTQKITSALKFKDEGQYFPY
jgi:hydroxymethylpyrimidine/phosphomethylpyrimidine kinase